ncbi:MAG: DUF4293 family protein [Rhodothermales bacterium]|nr:DUF4293 family protein [Rhodothermales bacterium]
MIQRIQSVYLILGVLALAAVVLLGDLGRPAHEPVAWFVPGATVALCLSALLGLVALFLFKTRDRQRRIIVLTQYATLVCMAVILAGLSAAGTLPTTRVAVSANWELLALPLVAYVLFWLARRGVDADIKLLKSVDRLR